MNVVMVAPEMVPFSKVGGLGDVLGALPHALVKLGAQVTVVIPHLASMDSARFGMASTGVEVRTFLGGSLQTAQVLESKGPGGVRVLALLHPPFFHRESLYGTRSGDYSDNAQRFAFFSHAALEAVKRLVPDVDIVHTHDWQTGLVPFLLRAHEHYGSDTAFSGAATVHTIHNLSYQGLFPADLLPQLGISWDHFQFRELEFFGWLNFLKAGLVSADALTTVSPTYAREIQTPQYAWGLHGVLAERANASHGILNGSDQDAWNPETDPALVAPYSAKKLAARIKNTRGVREAFGLPEDRRPLVGIVNRLVAQKGLDLLLGLDQWLEDLGLQWAILGAGDTYFEGQIVALAGRHPRTVAARIGFDDALAHMIYAGSDLFCMPSVFEPCGLGQMIALRYGSLPIVRRTGGLADTVRDIRYQGGVGFVFDKPDSLGLEEALIRVVKFTRRQEKLEVVRRRAMAVDHSWEASAQRYLDVYRSAGLARTGRASGLQGSSSTPLGDVRSAGV
jgi:starch synthase